MPALHLVLSIKYFVLREFAKKLMLFGFVYLLLTTYYLLVPSPAFAQNSPVATNSAQTYTQIPSQLSTQSPIYSNVILLNLLHALSCIGIGGSITGQPCVDYISRIDPQGKIQTIPVLSSVNTSGGILGAVNSVLIGMYANPPILASDYLADLGSQFGIVKEANAQSIPGSGNGVLSPILLLWQVSRNLAYLFLIIIFIVVGLMVMFRNKINPQTVITIQAALPGLVIGLILITFSYFIAALLTDLAFVGTDMVGYYFQIAQGNTTPSNLTQNIGDKNVLNLFSPFVGAIQLGDIHQALDIVWNQILESKSFSTEQIIRSFVAFAAYKVGAAVGPDAAYVSAGIICSIPGASSVLTGAFAAIGLPVAAAGFMACATVGKVVGTFVLPPALAAIGYAFPTLLVQFPIYFVAMFIILYAMGKLLLRLVNCYLAIIFYTITGPFHLLAASLPGRQGVAVSWVRNILCNVLCFPAVGAVIYFAGYILGSTHLPGSSGQLSIFNSNATLPLFGGLDLGFLRVLVAFGALVATPAIPDLICKSIGKPDAASDLLGREIQGNIGSGSRYSAEAGKNAGDVAKDVGNWKNKWYEDPYEPKGLRTRLEKYSPTTEAAIEHNYPLTRPHLSRGARDEAQITRDTENNLRRRLGRRTVEEEETAARTRHDAGEHAGAGTHDEDDETIPGHIRR